MTFREACLKVMKNCPDQYAKAYARAGADMAGDSHDAEVQALYILNNMRFWRGETATEVRTFLKSMKE